MDAIEALGGSDRDSSNFDHALSKHDVGVRIDGVGGSATDIFCEDQALIAGVVAIVVIGATIFCVLAVTFPSDLIKNAIHDHLPYEAVWLTQLSTR
jgi:hypothetical protein